jgi:protein gp37
MRFAGRFAKPGERYHGLVTIGKNKRAIWTGNGRLDAGKLAKPLHWKKPRRIFVNSMSDLFYEEFTNEEIAAVFGVMAACPQHTFQVLTKRARRMREWFAWAEQHGNSQDLMRFGPSALLTCAWEACAGDIWGDADDPFDGDLPTAERFGTAWPLPNVHLGISAENQPAFDERWPDLFGCPAAVWWFSAEPLLSGIDMTHMLADFACKRGELWLVTGCESGPGARSAEPDWYRSLRDLCKEAGVPFFLKQAREVKKGCVAPSSSPPEIIKAVSPTDRTRFTDIITAGPGSKRKAGGIIGLPYLDGVQHRAFPSTKEMTP